MVLKKEECLWGWARYVWHVMVGKAKRWRVHACKGRRVVCGGSEKKEGRRLQLPPGGTMGMWLHA